MCRVDAPVASFSCSLSLSPPHFFSACLSPSIVLCLSCPFSFVSFSLSCSFSHSFSLALFSSLLPSLSLSFSLFLSHSLSLSRSHSPSLLFFFLSLSLSFFLSLSPPLSLATHPRANKGFDQASTALVSLTHSLFPSPCLPLARVRSLSLSLSLSLPPCLCASSVYIRPPLSLSQEHSSHGSFWWLR